MKIFSSKRVRFILTILLAFHFSGLTIQAEAQSKKNNKKKISAPKKTNSKEKSTKEKNKETTNSSQAEKAPENSLQSPASSQESSEPSKAEPAGASATTTVTDVLPQALPPEKSDTLPPEIQKIRDSIIVNWFHPQSYPDAETKVVRIVLAGQTKQATRIYLKSNEIQILKSATERESKKLEAKDVKFLPGLADQRGVFAFELNLPVGNYQLSVAAVDPGAQTMSAAKVYILFLNVTLKGVEFGFVEEGDEKPFVPQSDYYSFGLGFNYAIFNKEVPSIPSEVRFSSFKFPTLRIGYAKTINPLWRLHASLVASPGETKTGTRIPVDGGTYLWTILNADGIFSKDTWKYEWRDYKIRYAVRGGLQMHNVPFVQSISTEDNTQGLLGVNYMTPVIGGHMDIMTDSEMSYEIFLRINVPFLYQSSIEMSNPMSFDGSLGARYRKKKSPWSYGIYWYGQWLKYNFSEEDKFVGSKVNGSFDILNSNLEFRAHYHY